MKTILVLTDFSTAARDACEYAFSLASETNAEILLYNSVFVPNTVPVEGGIYPPLPDISELELDSTNKLKELANDLPAKLRKPDRVTPSIRYKNKVGLLTDNLPGLLKQENVWMIVIGNKAKKGFVERMIFGSSTSGVIEDSTRPVLLVPENLAFSPIQTIAFASDFHGSDNRAVHFLASLAYCLNANINLVHVFEKPDEARKKGLDFFNKLKGDINYYKFSYEPVDGENVAKMLAGFSEEKGIDLLAIAHQEHPFFRRVFSSSKTHELLKYHHVPLLVFPKRF